MTTKTSAPPRTLEYIRTHRAETINAWTTALRSGDYAQGTGALQKQGKFCCLGVICDVLDPEMWISPVDALEREEIAPLGWLGLADEVGEYGPTLGIQAGRLDIPFIEAIGFDDSQQQRLIMVNDDIGPAHRDFAGIADLIEELAFRNGIDL